MNVITYIVFLVGITSLENFIIKTWNFFFTKTDLRQIIQTSMIITYYKHGAHPCYGTT